MEKFLQRLLQLLPVLGVHFFYDPELMLQRSSENVEVFYSISSVQAQGFRTDDGFLILKGSRAVKDVRSSCPPSVIKQREVLLAKGILAEEDDALIFTRDFEMMSPGMAASMIAGSSRNGLLFWKNAQGKTLKELGV